MFENQVHGYKFEKDTKEKELNELKKKFFLMVIENITILFCLNNYAFILVQISNEIFRKNESKKLNKKKKNLLKKKLFYHWLSQ